MIPDYLTFAWKSILHRGIRSWLTILGMVIGVAAIISLITVGQGMENAIEEQFQTLGIRNIRIVPADLQGPPSTFFTLSDELIEKVKDIRVVDYVDTVLIESGVLESSREERFITVYGYDVALAERGFADIDVDTQEGRLFASTDRGIILLGHSVAKEFFDREVRAKNMVALNGKKFSVIGILEETGTELDQRAYIPLEDARTLFSRPHGANIAVVHLKEGIDIAEGQRIIEQELLRSFDDEDFDTLTPQQILDRINTILGAVQAVVAGIAAISIFVGVVGIMNAMFTSVLERTRDIGIMKALGARNSDILLIFLAEAGIVGAVGGVVGILVGTALAFGVGFFAQAAGFPFLSVRLELPVIAFAFLLSILAGAIAGMLPALQAARLKPVDALHYE